jgi:hypothetical protein
MATEKNAYNDDCFVKSFHLSARSMHQRFNRSVSHLFGGRTLVSWGIFAAPRHPIVFRTMENIVELIKLEYFHKSVVNMYRFDARWKLCMCTTGPSVLTASAREVVLEHNETGSEEFFGYKVLRRDFHDFGGVFKMPDYDVAPPKDGGRGGHYMHTMQKFNIPLLGHYAELGLEELEGRVISGDGKDLFLLENGTRRGFADYETFLQFHFSIRHVVMLDPSKVSSLPLNGTLMGPHDAVNYLASATAARANKHLDRERDREKAHGVGHFADKEDRPVFTVY